MQKFIAPTAAMLAVLATLIAAEPAKAQEVAMPGTAVELTTTIDAIDPVNRLVTVTGPYGNTVVMRAGPEIPGLDQLKAGDQIKVSYDEQTAFALSKYQGPPINKDESVSREETAGMDMHPPTVAVQQDWVESPPGANPSLGTVDRVEVTATVKKINYADRLVTLFGPYGTTRVVFVDPSVPGLRDIEQGDRVVMLVTEAMAINVTP